MGDEHIGACEGCGTLIYADDSYHSNDGGFMFCEDCCERSGDFGEEGILETTAIYCPACSRGGGADRAIYHSPPPCS